MSDEPKFSHVKVTRSKRWPLNSKGGAATIKRIEIDGMELTRTRGITVKHAHGEVTLITITIIGTYEEVYEPDEAQQ